ncbi:MAG TPA: hypothetical protein VN418_08610 [Gammaproteobacteria bacterium]|nr:hypothetical protein [Gammaproteobacteria bacterium]
MDYVPGSKMIEEYFNEFLSEASDVAGVYGNHDVDSIIFSYDSSKNNILDAIEQSATKKNWNPKNRTNNELELYRQYPPREGSLGFWSYELVRVSRATGTKKVCVGWLQIDESSEVKKPDNTGEGKWAALHFWPKYENCKFGSNKALHPTGYVGG